MTFMIFVFVGLVIVGVCFQNSVRKDLKAGAVTRPVGTVGALQNVQDSTPISASSTFMDNLKEGLFQLEVERRQGRISEEEYQASKATLTQVLERTLKR